MSCNIDRYYSFDSFIKNKIGEKAVKLSIDAGFTCPNRDGRLSYKGCIFCSGKGSGDFSGSRLLTITEQMQQQKELLKNKWGYIKSYIAYFQAFTNTYASPKELFEKYNEALEFEGVKAVAIATRPDCINDDVIEVLNNIKNRAYTWVELGLQTSNENTAKTINRCYDNRCFEEALKKLKKANIDVAAHIIIGLPHENIDDWLNTIKYVNTCNVDGVKLQLLHVIKNTAIAQMYNSGEFDTLTIEQYIEAIGECIKMLDKNIVIHRLTGDGAKDSLISPTWSLNKRNVLNSINKYLKDNNIYQGCGLEETYE